jgi:aryl-alcohol dehydrogenase-like predicted oxidoreductase
MEETTQLATRALGRMGRHDTTPGAVAVAWTVRSPALDGAIVGFRRADQVEPTLAELDETARLAA